MAPIKNKLDFLRQLQMLYPGTMGKLAAPEDVGPQLPNLGDPQQSGIIKERTLAPVDVPEYTPPPPSPPAPPSFLDRVRSWNDDPQKLQALRDISEGFGRVGNAVTRGNMMVLGMNPATARPYQATGIQDRLAEIDRDKLLGVQQSFKEKMLGKQQDFSGKQLDKTLQNRLEIAKIGAASRGGEVSPEIVNKFQKDLGIDVSGMNEVMARAFAADVIRAKAQTSLDARSKSNRELREKYGDRLSTAALTNLGEINATSNMVQETKRLYDVVKDKVGPISSRLQIASGRWLGIEDPDFRSLEAMNGMLVWQYLKAIHGSRATDADYVNIMNQLGRLIDEPETYHAAMDRLAWATENKSESLLKTYKGAGYKIPENINLPGKKEGEEKIEEVINGEKIRGTRSQLDKYKEYLKQKSVK